MTYISLMGMLNATHSLAHPRPQPSNDDQIWATMQEGVPQTDIHGVDELKPV